MEKGGCWGITRIHRLPSRPSHPYGRQPHSLIFMSTLYKASSRLPAKQLTNDHEPACMCHLYRLRINTHLLNKHHDLCYRATIVNDKWLFRHKCVISKIKWNYGGNFSFNFTLIVYLMVPLWRCDERLGLSYYYPF